MKLHYLACEGHFWCNEHTHSANLWAIPLAILTFAVIGGILLALAVLQSRR